jgi:uncharacterized membrane protein YhaH (DUF805 family)
MTPGRSIATCLAKYTDFRGRAQRSELWWFFLFAVVVSWVAAILDSVLVSGWSVGPFAVTGPFGAVTNLLVLLPSLAVGARRLHDSNRTGWWQVLLVIPCVGLVLLAVFWCLAGDEGANRYGEPVTGGAGG